MRARAERIASTRKVDIDPYGMVKHRFTVGCVRRMYDESCRGYPYLVIGWCNVHIEWIL